MTLAKVFSKVFLAVSWLALFWASVLGLLMTTLMLAGIMLPGDATIAMCVILFRTATAVGLQLFGMSVVAVSWLAYKSGR
ncbi:MAG TPA: hypothetical protein VHY91_15680 [Pirellulales bacterium]|jgi:hypothetical protein|nr:hypothetical protein [Pirellulales bacterium]